MDTNTSYTYVCMHVTVHLFYSVSVKNYQLLQQGGITVTATSNSLPNVRPTDALILHNAGPSLEGQHLSDMKNNTQQLLNNANHVTPQVLIN